MFNKKKKESNGGGGGDGMYIKNVSIISGREEDRLGWILMRMILSFSYNEDHV